MFVEVGIFLLHRHVAILEFHLSQSSPCIYQVPASFLVHWWRCTNLRALTLTMDIWTFSAVTLILVRGLLTRVVCDGEDHILTSSNFVYHFLSINVWPYFYCYFQASYSKHEWNAFGFVVWFHTTSIAILTTLLSSLPIVLLSTTLLGSTIPLYLIPLYLWSYAVLFAFTARVHSWFIHCGLPAFLINFLGKCLSSSVRRLWKKLIFAPWSQVFYFDDIPMLQNMAPPRV